MPTTTDPSPERPCDRRRGAAAALLAGVLLAPLAGCGGGIEGDLRQRFEERYAKELCVDLGAPFPLEVHPIRTAESTARWLQALHDAGLVTAGPGARVRGLVEPNWRFELTESGQRAWSAEKGFCYGRTVVAEIVDYTKPAENMGALVVQAEARLRHDVQADWARQPQLEGLAKRGEETVSMVLVKKEKGGWSPAY